MRNARHVIIDLSSSIEQRLQAPQTVFGNSLVSRAEQPTVAGILWNLNLQPTLDGTRINRLTTLWSAASGGLLGTVLPPQKGTCTAYRLWTELTQRAESIARRCSLARAPIRPQRTVVRADGIIING